MLLVYSVLPHEIRLTLRAFAFGISLSFVYVNNIWVALLDEIIMTVEINLKYTHLYVYILSNGCPLLLLRPMQSNQKWMMYHPISLMITGNIFPNG